MNRVPGFLAADTDGETLVDQIDDDLIKTRMLGPNLIIDDPLRPEILFFGPDSQFLGKIYKEWNDQEGEDYDLDSFIELASKIIEQDRCRKQQINLIDIGW